MTEIVLGIVLLTVIVLLLAVTVMFARSILSPSRPAVLTVNGSSKFDTSTGVKLLSALNETVSSCHRPVPVRAPAVCAGSRS